MSGAHPRSVLGTNMKLLLLLLLCSCREVQPMGRTRIREHMKIVHGYTASPGDHPYFVRLIIKRGSSHSVCGGSFVAARRVVTAAHCVSQATFVTAALHEFPFTQADAVSIGIHPSYDAATLAHDVAFLELASDLGTSFLTIPDTLPAWRSDLALRTVGFGVSDIATMELAEELQVADLAAMSTDECMSFWSSSMILDDLCAIGACYGDSACIDACMGDSGGPLVGLGTTNLLGVVSRGASQCGLFYMPGIYTTIVPYREFLLEGNVTLTTPALPNAAAASPAPLLCCLAILLALR